MTPAEVAQQSAAVRSGLLAANGDSKPVALGVALTVAISLAKDMYGTRAFDVLGLALDEIGALERREQLRNLLPECPAVPCDDVVGGGDLPVPPHARR